MRIFNTKNQHFFIFRGVKLIDSSAISPHLKERIESQGYESGEIDLALEQVNKDDIVLELGAGIGAVSTVILKYRSVRDYICVEANPQLVSLIKKNHLENNVQCTVLSGIMTNSSTENEFDFYSCEDFWRSSLIEPDSYSSRIKVRGYNFNSILNKYKPTYLICDIEGGEFSLFSGEVDLSSVRKICIEVHQTTQRRLVDLYAFFIDNGFQLNTPPFDRGVHIFAKR